MSKPRPPSCRWCNRAIHKKTTIASIHKEPTEYHHPSARHRYVYVGEEWPKTIEDCRRLSNQHVVSMNYSTLYEDGKVVGRKLKSFGEWDGQSYEDEFFCSGSCAKKFGYAAARHFDARDQATEGKDKCSQSQRKTRSAK